MMKMEQAPPVAVGRTHGELIVYLGNKCGDFIWLFRSVRGEVSYPSLFLCNRTVISY